jgi:hypothetical protein
MSQEDHHRSSKPSECPENSTSNSTDQALAAWDGYCQEILHAVLDG